MSQQSDVRTDRGSNLLLFLLLFSSFLPDHTLFAKEDHSEAVPGRMLSGPWGNTHTLCWKGALCFVLIVSEICSHCGLETHF